jgi:hypothetical protein
VRVGQQTAHAGELGKRGIGARKQAYQLVVVVDRGRERGGDEGPESLWSPDDPAGVLCLEILWIQRDGLFQGLSKHTEL